MTGSPRSRQWLVDDKTRADELLAEAAARRAAGRAAEAIPLYQEAAALFPPYASIELVAADSLFELGRYEEAAESYGRVTDAVGATLIRDDSSDAVRRYAAAETMDQRAAAVTTMLRSLDDGVADALHDFLVRSRDDPVGPGHGYLPLLASILVRFGIADFVYWYADGPAPNRDWIRADVDKYLAVNRRPPPVDRQRPIWGSPPPKTLRRQRERAAKHRAARVRSGPGYCGGCSAAGVDGDEAAAR